MAPGKGGGSGGVSGNCGSCGGGCGCRSDGDRFGCYGGCGGGGSQTGQGKKCLKKTKLERFAESVRSH